MSSKKDVKNDEIDLLELFRKMGRIITGWFVALGEGIIICIVFLFRNWLPLVISLIIAVSLAFIMKKTLTPCYSSEITIRSNTISNADMISYINRLHSFCMERNIAALSEAISIPQEKARQIKDIKAFWVIDRNNDSIPDYVDYKNEYNVYDTVNLRMRDRLDIMAKFISLQDLSFLKNGLLSYVESNSLFRQKNELRLLQVNEMLTRLKNDIGQLDSLQRIKYFEETRNRIPEKNGQIIFLQDQKTQLLYGDIYALYIRKQALDQNKDLYSDIITVLSDFTVPAKPFTGFLYYAKVLVPFLFGLTLIILILSANRKKIRDFIKEY
jgi:hypothetical protein